MKICGGHRPPLHEMKTLYLDIFSGISGDMFLGALLDLGVDAHTFEHELEKLRLDGYHLHISRREKSGIAGVKFDIHLAGEHSHEHEHEQEQNERSDDPLIETGERSEAALCRVGAGHGARSYP